MNNNTTLSAARIGPLMDSESWVVISPRVTRVRPWVRKDLHESG